MAVAREQITGTTPQDINKMNKNMETLWFKLFGNLEMSDTNSEFIKNVMTQWIPIQGEGNLDVSNPYKLRFYIPPNTKSITKTSVNVQIERYKMDSSITEGGGRSIGMDISMSMGSANVGVSSVGGGGGSASTTSLVSRWYPYSENGAKGDYFSPGTRMLTKDIFLSLTQEGNIFYGNPTGGHVLGAKTPMYSDSVALMDLSALNHEHDVAISTPPHSHNIILAPHTHTAIGTIDLPDHSHALKEGIKLASVAPADVNVKLNGTSISVLNGDSAYKNDINVSEYIKIGEWNTIECTTSNLARINIYGVIELVQKFNVLK